MNLKPFFTPTRLLQVADFATFIWVYIMHTAVFAKRGFDGDFGIHASDWNLIEVQKEKCTKTNTFVSISREYFSPRGPWIQRASASAFM